MLAGAYSKRFRKLQEYQIEKLKLLNASYEEYVYRNNEETANTTGKARRLSQETNKRRKVLALRRRQESQKEESRRKEILLNRRLMQQEATERFQKAPLQNRKGTSCPNTPLEEVLQIIRGETPNRKTTSQITKPHRSNSANIQKEVQFGSATITTKPPIHTPSQLLYLFGPSERAALCNQKNLKGMMNNRDLFEQQLRRHQQQPSDQGTSSALREELSDSDQSSSSNGTNKKKCKLPSSAVNQNTPTAITDHITKFKKMPLVTDGNKVVDEQYSLNGNQRTCEPNSEGNGYGDCSYSCNVSGGIKQERTPDSEPSTNAKWPNHKAAQVISPLGPNTVSHSAANVKPITAWSSPGTQSNNDNRMNGTMETCHQLEDYCQMQNACTRDTKWPQNSTIDPNNMLISGGRTWTLSKHNIYERQLSNFSNTYPNISHSSSKPNEPATENHYTDIQSNVALQNGCNSTIYKTTESSKRNVASACKNNVTNATSATQQYSANSYQSTRQNSTNSHQAVKQNSANSHQAVRQNSTNSNQAVRQNSTNSHQAERQNSTNSNQAVKQNSTNSHQAVKQNSANSHQAVKQNSANNHQAVKQTSANSHEAVRQNSANSHQEMKQTSANSHQAVRQTSANSHQTVRQTSANSHQTVRQNSANSHQEMKQNSANSHQATKQNSSNCHHEIRQNSANNHQTIRWNPANSHQARQEVPDHMTVNRKTGKTGPDIPTNAVIPMEKKLNSTCIELRTQNNGNDANDNIDDANNNNNNNDKWCKNKVPYYYASPKVIVRKQSDQTSGETNQVNMAQKMQAFHSCCSNSRNLKANCNNSENVIAETQANLTKKDGISIRSILKHQTYTNINQSAIPFQPRDSLEVAHLHYPTNQKENTSRNQKPTKKHVHFATENILCEKHMQVSNVDWESIAGFVADKPPLSTNLMYKADHTTDRYHGQQSGIVNENQENQYGSRPTAKAYIITQSTVDNDVINGGQTLTNNCNETPGVKPADRKARIQHITMGKLKNMFTSQIPFPTYDPDSWNISNQTGNKKHERGEPTSNGEVSVKPSIGIHVDKTPTDEDINLVWQKVRSCINQKSTYRPQHQHQHQPQQQQLQQLKYQQQQQQQLQHKQQSIVNTLPNHFNNRLLRSKTADWSSDKLSATHWQGLDTFSPLERTDSHIRRLTFLQQKAKQHRLGHYNNNNNNNSHYNNNNNNVSDSLAAFLTAEDYSKQVHVTDKQMTVAMNHAATEQQVLNRRQMHMKGPTILSLEERRLMESLERINNKLKASRITKYQ